MQSQFSPDIIKMNTKFHFVLFLNLKFCKVLNKIDSSDYVIQFLLRLDLFQMKNMTSKEKKICYKKQQILQHFLLEDFTHQNIVPLKTCIVHRTFQVFILKCVNCLSKNCVVKVKSNLDIILSEITFDNGGVKR